MGFPIRLGQWWAGVPFITSGVGIIYGLVYLVCELVGYTSFVEICFLPSAVIDRFQVYRIYTSILFHSSLLHLMFNMLALVTLGSVLERITGSVRFLNVIFILGASNALFHLLIVALATYNPLYPYPHLMNECAIGFSGIIFAMIVIEANLSGIQCRRYALILLIMFQLLVTKVSVIGHLCGLFSGFAYIYGMYNYLLLGPSLNSAIESSALLSACVRRPGFIIGSVAYLPTYSNNTCSNSASEHMWRNLCVWVPEREAPAAELSQDNHRFPGRVITQGSTSSVSSSSISTLGLPSRVFDNRITMAQISDGRHSSIENAGVAGPSTHTQARGKAIVSSTCSPSTSLSNTNLAVAARLFDCRTTGCQISDGRITEIESSGVAGPSMHNQDLCSFDEALQKLVVMGFDKNQAEVALGAADGDSNLAVEILVNQLGDMETLFIGRPHVGTRPPGCNANLNLVQVEPYTSGDARLYAVELYSFGYQG